MKAVVFGLFAIVFGVACLFFAYYSVRLLYINIAVPGVAAHRQVGMYIGAIAFPVATLVFGWLSWRCGSRSRPRDVHDRND